SILSATPPTEIHTLSLHDALPIFDDAGWRILTTRFAIFFATMAALNEVVWRTQSTEFWVNFKVFGILVLTLAFTMGQVALINRHTISEPAESGPDVRT